MPRQLPVVVACVLLLAVPALARGDVRGTLFEPPEFTAGQPFTNSAGWVQASFAGQDHQIVANAPGGRVFPLFGTQSLRISNAAISTAFGDQTRSAALIDAAGEQTAASEGVTGGVRRSRFVAALRFASAGLATTADPPQQPGLDVAISPSNALTGRMGFVRITDQPNGLRVVWTDYSRNAQGRPAFVDHVVADGLPRSSSHLLVFALWFKDGSDDDVAKIAVDGGRAVTATSWEEYYREVAHQAPPAVNLLLFQTRTQAVPALAGQGLLFDDVRIATPLFSPRSGTLTPPVTPVTPTTPTPPAGAGPSAPVAGADTGEDPSPLELRSATMDHRRHQVRLVLFCPAAAGLCAGVATIRADRQNLTSRGFNQRGGARFPLTIRLSASVRRRLARAHRIEGLILSRDQAGQATRLTRTLPR